MRFLEEDYTSRWDLVEKFCYTLCTLRPCWKVTDVKNLGIAVVVSLKGVSCYSDFPTMRERV